MTNSKKIGITDQLSRMAVKLAGKPEELAKVDAVRAAIEAKDSNFWYARRDTDFMVILREVAAQTV